MRASRSPLPTALGCQGFDRKGCGERSAAYGDAYGLAAGGDVLTGSGRLARNAPGKAGAPSYTNPNGSPTYLPQGESLDRI
jgi:hypothetical protein